jgi:hypothetical protein
MAAVQWLPTVEVLHIRCVHCTENAGYLSHLKMWPRQHPMADSGCHSARLCKVATPVRSTRKREGEATGQPTGRHCRRCG